MSFTNFIISVSKYKLLILSLYKNFSCFIAYMLKHDFLWIYVQKFCLGFFLLCLLLLRGILINQTAKQFNFFLFNVAVIYHVIKPEWGYAVENFGILTSCGYKSGWSNAPDSHLMESREGRYYSHKQNDCFQELNSGPPS